MYKSEGDPDPSNIFNSKGNKLCQKIKRIPNRCDFL